MEELIRQSILIGDSGINRRFLTEIHCDAETETVGRLYDYRDVIINTLDELYENTHYASITPMLTSQMRLHQVRWPAPDCSDAMVDYRHQDSGYPAG